MPRRARRGALPSRAATRSAHRDVAHFCGEDARARAAVDARRRSRCAGAAVCGGAKRGRSNPTYRPCVLFPGARRGGARLFSSAPRRRDASDTTRRGARARRGEERFAARGRERRWRAACAIRAACGRRRCPRVELARLDGRRRTRGITSQARSAGRLGRVRAVGPALAARKARGARGVGGRDLRRGRSACAQPPGTRARVRADGGRLLLSPSPPSWRASSAGHTQRHAAVSAVAAPTATRAPHRADLVSSKCTGDADRRALRATSPVGRWSSSSVGRARHDPLRAGIVFAAAPLCQMLFNPLFGRPGRDARAASTAERRRRGARAGAGARPRGLLAARALSGAASVKVA